MNDQDNKDTASKEPTPKIGKDVDAAPLTGEGTQNIEPQQTGDIMLLDQGSGLKKVEEPSMDVDVPELLEGQTEEHSRQAYLDMYSDSTAVIEISIMKNKKYSEEIIDKVKDSYSIDRLQELKGDRKNYLAEARDQINTLWEGIHGLVIHTEMFTVLFLIAVGVILRAIKDEFEKPHEFARWRDTTFGIRHCRLFQQAIQLEGMGNFSRKYAPIGKTRLLQLEHIRKAEKMDSCEALLRECQVYDEITEDVLPDEVVERMDVEPFPDISYDLDTEQIKHYVNSIITYKRLRKLGLNFVDFEHAQIISEDYQQAIPMREATVLQKHLEEYTTRKKRLDIFNSILMDGSKIVSSKGGKKESGYSLNKHVSDLITFCRDGQLDNDEWIEEQKRLIEKEAVLQALNYLNLISQKMGFDSNEQISQAEEV